jgi:hypothetical protein
MGQAVLVVQLVSTRRRTVETAAVLCGSEVVSSATVYTIVDPQKALMAFNDVFSFLDDRIQAAIVSAHTQAASNAEICALALADVRGHVAEYGVEVHSVNVLQRGWAFPLKNLNDWAQHAKAEL